MSEYIITDEQIAENRRLHGRKLLVMPVIVRCRDCSYFTPADAEHGNNDWCSFHEHIGWSYKGFCMWARHKEVNEL